MEGTQVPFGLNGLLEPDRVKSGITCIWNLESTVTLTVRSEHGQLLAELPQLQRGPWPESVLLFAYDRAKKIRNKAVVNTSMPMRESRAENSKLLLSCGNSRITGKLSQESRLSPSQQPEGGEPEDGPAQA